MADFLGLRAASREFFGGEISQWTLRSWIRTGKLRAYKVGSRVLLKREDLEALLKPRYPNSLPGREARQ